MTQAACPSFSAPVPVPGSTGSSPSWSAGLCLSFSAISAFLDVRCKGEGGMPQTVTSLCTHEKR
eukprot:7755234-Pyramimonas_sp.AAC.2